jgi:hypothetical protein
MKQHSTRHFLVAFLLITTGLILLYRPAVYNSFAPPPLPSPSPSPVPHSAALTIDFGNRKTYSITQDIPATTSAFDLLQIVSSRQNIPLTFKSYSFGTLVESIDGLKNTPQKAWIYFVNGQSPNVGADKYLLQPGDKVDWQYIKPNL